MMTSKMIRKLVHIPIHRLIGITRLVLNAAVKLIAFSEYGYGCFWLD